MMAALEAALSAQSSKYATVSQQLRLELKEGLTKANQVCVGAGGWGKLGEETGMSCKTRHRQGSCTLRGPACRLDNAFVSLITTATRFIWPPG
jgi:hypothetical protein